MSLDQDTTVLFFCFVFWWFLFGWCGVTFMDHNQRDVSFLGRGATPPIHRTRRTNHPLSTTRRCLSPTLLFFQSLSQQVMIRFHCNHFSLARYSVLSPPFMVVVVLSGLLILCSTTTPVTVCVASRTFFLHLFSPEQANRPTRASPNKRPRHNKRDCLSLLFSLSVVCSGVACCCVELDETLSIGSSPQQKGTATTTIERANDMELSLHTSWFVWGGRRGFVRCDVYGRGDPTFLRARPSLLYCPGSLSGRAESAPVNCPNGFQE